LLLLLRIADLPHGVSFTTNSLVLIYGPTGAMSLKCYVFSKTQRASSQIANSEQPGCQELLLSSMEGALDVAAFSHRTKA
jgi:hypothetical protein